MPLGPVCFTEILGILLVFLHLVFKKKHTDKQPATTTTH